MRENSKSKYINKLKRYTVLMHTIISYYAYNVPRSVEQQLQQAKKIVRLVDIGVLEEDYSSEWASSSPSFAIPKKNGSITIRVITDFRKFNLLLKHGMSPISYSKDWQS
jgi:hypothetical protein